MFPQEPFNNANFSPQTKAEKKLPRPGASVNVRLCADSHRLVVRNSQTYFIAWRQILWGELLIEKHLRGLLASISHGVGLDWFAQALLLGPLRDSRPVAVWLIAVEQGPTLRVLGSASLMGRDAYLSIDDEALYEIFLSTVLDVSGSERFNRDSDDLPTGLSCEAPKYSVLPVIDSSLPKGFVMVHHAKPWPREHLDEEFSQAIEAIALHAIEASERSHWKGRALESVASSLSERQRLILQKIAAGLTNYQIGHQINVSESTVKQECIKIFRFLNVNTRGQAVDAGLRLGIIRDNLHEDELSGG